MRFNQITEDTVFATCNGAAVRVVAPLSQYWQQTFVMDENGKPEIDPKTRSFKTKYVITERDAPLKSDPWSTCGTGRSDSTRSKRGILVEEMDYDADGVIGKPTGVRFLVRAAQIGGTWTEYLTLHADKVRAEGERRASFKAQEESRNEIEEALAPLVTSLRDAWGDLGTIPPRDPSVRRAEVVAVSPSHLSSSTTSDASRVPSTPEIQGAIIRPPRDYTAKKLEGRGISIDTTKSEPMLVISAGTWDQVNVLAEVIRAGIAHRASLAKRRERDARARQAKPKKGLPTTA